MTSGDFDRERAFDVRERIAELDPATRTTVMGWCSTIRDLGGVTFVTLRDASGELQVTVDRDDAEQSVCRVVDELTTESTVAVTGTVERDDRAPDGRELVPERIHVLNEARKPLPLDVRADANTDRSTRLDSRTLDLRRDEIAAIFGVCDVVLDAIRDTLRSYDATEITTPTIVSAENEGENSQFEIEYFDRTARLSQSSLQHRQLTVGGGFEAVFEVGPIFSGEKHNSRKLLNEATGIGFEQAFASLRSTASIAEEVITASYERVEEKCSHQLDQLGVALSVPETPFERVTYRECLELASDAQDEVDLAWGDNPWAVTGADVGESIGDFYVVTEWPIELRPSYVRPTEEDDNVASAFSIFHPSANLLSGSQREYRYERRRTTLEQASELTEADEHYLEPFDCGMPPHAGWSMGLERLLMTMLELDNIREASLFPRGRQRLSP